MVTKRLPWGAIAAVSVVALTFGIVGCELIASVDRTLIPTATGGAAPTGGSNPGGGGAGGAYSQAGFADEAAYSEWYQALPAGGDRAVTMGIDVAWQDAVTRPLPFDLSIELDGAAAPLVQLFTIDQAPFAKIGARVEPLRPEVSYRLEVSRTAVSAWVQVVRVHDDHVLVSGAVMEIESSSGDAVLFRQGANESRVRLGEIRVWPGPGTQ